MEAKLYLPIAYDTFCSYCSLPVRATCGVALAKSLWSTSVGGTCTVGTRALARSLLHVTRASLRRVKEPVTVQSRLVEPAILSRVSFGR